MGADAEGPYFDDPVREADRIARVTKEWYERLAAEKAAGDARRALYRARRAGETPWWRDLLVWQDAADGEDPALDMLGSIEALPRHDATAAAAVVKRVGTRLFSVTDIQKSRFLRVWNGRIWGEDSGEVQVWSWIQDFWEAYRRALSHLVLTIEAEADDAAERERASGGSPADVKRARAEMVRLRQAQIKKHHAFFDRLGNSSGRDACAELLAHVPERCRVDAEFDAVCEFVVVRNGVLDLTAFSDALDTRSGVVPAVSLLPHDSGRLVTQVAAGVDYAPEVGVGEVFAGYVSGVLPDVRVRWHLQKALGVALLGKPRDKMVLELIGQPNSGKSVLIEVLGSVLEGYAQQSSPDTFTVPVGRDGKPAPGRGRRGGDASPDLMRLRHAKMVMTSEPDPGSAFDVALIKRITGREQIQSRNLYSSNVISWVPRFVLVIATNDWIRLDVADDAAIARVHPIHFEKVFVRPTAVLAAEDIAADELADVTLTSRIVESETERSGVLNWLLAGLEGYLREGLLEPEEITGFRDEMVGGMSSIVEWLEAQIAGGRIIRDAGDSRGWPQIACIGVTELMDVYNDEALGAGEIPVKAKTFRKQIGSHGMKHPQRRVNRGKPCRGRNNESLLDRLWWCNTAEQLGL